MYNPINFDHDICLIRVKYGFDFSQFNNVIAPACLPSKYQTYPDGTQVLNIGWGATAEGMYKCYI